MPAITTRVTTTSIVSQNAMKEISVQQQDSILIIKINRPHSKNALNRKAIYELIGTIQDANHNSLIKLVVITGVGDYFTAGNDLKQIQDYENPEHYYRSANYVIRALVTTVIACNKLLVCLVNGPCIGIGFTLAGLCDAVYCTKNAYFQTPFSQLGLCAEACSSLTFPQHFGKSWSTRILIFGEKMTAYKAEQLGFVAEVFDNDLEVEERFWNKMKDYANLPAESLRITKKLIKAHNVENFMRALSAELKEIEKMRRGQVYQQAIEIFIQKSKSKL